MTQRKHLSMDEDAAELLDEYQGNQSELVSSLVREYFTVGVYDEEQAAKRRRKKVVKGKIDEYESELEALRSEFEMLAEMEDEETESSVEVVASELEMSDPEKIHEHNPAIATRAERNGIDAGVLAEEVMRQYQERQASELSSVNADD